MPNPRAQSPLTLDKAVSDLQSFAQPAQAMGDMLASTLRGSVAGTVGFPGDIRELIDTYGPEAVQRVLGPRVMPTTEEMNKMLPPAVPTNAPASRQHTADVYGSMGEFLPTPGAGTLTKAASYGLGRAAGTAVRGGAEAINNAHLYGQGPLAAITPQVQRMFIGPQAKTYDVGRAMKAEEMLKAGASPQEVWKATGTMIGKDGIPRQEISDAGAIFRGPDELKQLKENYKTMIEAGKEKLRPDRTGQKDLFPKQLTEAKKPFREQLAGLKEDLREIDKNPRTQGVKAKWTLEHPELYRAYPQLGEISVTQRPTIGAEKGSLTTLGGVIQDMEVKDIKDPRSVALHEMMHGVQNIEGMAPGANPMMAFTTPEYKKFYETYKKAELAGLPEGATLSTKDDDRLAQKAAHRWYQLQHGEQEARATQARKDMGPAERQQSYPYNSYDDNPNDLLMRKANPYVGVRMSDEGAAMPDDLQRMREELRAKAERDKALQDAYNKHNRNKPLNEWPTMEEFRATNTQPSQSELDQMRLDLDDQRLAGGGEVRYDEGGSIKATPRNEFYGAAADIAKAIEDASKEQFGYKNPATEVIADFFGVPAIARTLERKAYGEPITNIGKANVPVLPDDTAEAFMSVAPLSGKAAKGAKTAGKAALGEVEKAMFGESSSKLLNAATPQVMSVYKPHTPSKPDPDVGTRYKKEYIGGLAPRKDLDIEDLEKQKASVKIFPWDATSRNQLISEVSEVPLTKPVLTEGGDEYMRDLNHIKNRIAGASNEGISKRIQDRINQASVENQALGGSGRVYGFSSRMGPGAENAATAPTDIVLDLLGQAGLKKSEMKALDSDMRNMMFEGDKGVFKNMAPIGTPEFEAQLRQGLAGDKKKGIQGFTAMNMRKAFMDRLGKVEYQKRLGYNLPDLTGAVLADELKGVPKGYVGNSAAELDPFSQITPSNASAYSHNFGGIYAGGMPNMPLEFLMPNTYEGIYLEMKHKYPKATPEALRNMTIGAMEKRKENISEMISPRSVDATKVYQEGLAKGEFDPNDIKQVYDYMRRKKLQLKLKKGGEVTGDDLIIEECPL
jgi:hypothetical protein